jgi:hypothetical protein
MLIVLKGFGQIRLLSRLGLISPNLFCEIISFDGGQKIGQLIY